MPRRRLMWTMYLTFLTVIVLCTTAVGWYSVRAIRQAYLSRTEAGLWATATLAAAQAAPLVGSPREGEIDALTKQLGRSVATRLTVIRASGEVVGDSLADPATMENHADRLEVKQVLAGAERGVDVHFSETLRENRMYVAVPLRRDGRDIAVVRASVPLSEINAVLGDLSGRILAVGVSVALLVTALMLVVSRRISRPLKDIAEGALRFAQGDFSRRVLVPEYEEIGQLAETLNQMAAKLQERLRTITEEKNTLEAVLSSMVEGVVAVDTEGHVLDLNPAANRLLGLGGSDSRGRTIEEVVRNVHLQAFVSRALAAPTTIEDEIVLERPEGDRYVQAHGTALRDGEGHEMGALVVLNDVTRIRQLENVRRDFVANVSHELKTPITSVKGFVETLLDGALDNREEAERFLRIVAKHADRLGVIIEDLLTLSRLEQDARAGRVDLQEASVEGALRAAVEMCEVRATERNVTVTVICDPQLRADLNLPLFEQAIANLIDNAIKYSPTGGTVEVSGQKARGELVVCVRDWGCGIAAEHLPRLFERFYRVDKARSRALGGTGLGLAIVKHIVQAHGGTVSVESTPGKGSTFTIRLPRALPPLPLSTT